MPAAIRTSNSTVKEARARRRVENAQQLIAELSSPLKDGRAANVNDRLASVRKMVEQGLLETYKPILPVLFQLKGKPYTLDDHFPFEPFFHTHTPSTSTWKTGRQVAKTTSTSADGILKAVASSWKTLLYVCPLYEQIRRLSGNYVRPLIDQSPVRDLWVSTETDKSVLQRSFRNHSKMIFSFALLDADRIRGVSSDAVIIDEIQDMMREHLPIIRETMAASEWKIQRFTGTPKTLDNTLEGLWRDSSMAEWFVPCWACGHLNIPSIEYDLEAMLGPLHEDICETYPATICARPGCRRPIDPRYGRWVHRIKERRWTQAGFHVPQVLLPMHYGKFQAWADILGKREGAANTAPHQFLNEVLGESSATGNQLVTLDDLQRAAVLPWDNRPDDPEQAFWQHLTTYPTRVLAVDWGGGGKKGVSFTVMALLGFRSDGQVHLLWGKRLLTPHLHVREAIQIFEAFQRFRPHFLTHDYTGAGSVRETVLVQAGVPLEKIVPIALCRSAAHSMFTPKPATPEHQRDHYLLDKTRSLQLTCAAIKHGGLLTFRPDYTNDSNRGLLRDFLALVDEKVESKKAGDIYMITSAEGFSDDFAQAVNLGAVVLWYVNQAWPNLAQLGNLAGTLLSAEQVEAVAPASPAWDSDLYDGPEPRFLRTP